MSSLPNFTSRNLYVRLLVVIFSFGIVVGSGIGSGVSEILFNGKQQELTAPSEIGRVSLIKYERLQRGMTLTDVRAILGSNGTEVEQTPTRVTFVWNNPDSSKITAIFEDGKLKIKNQSQLK